MFYFWSVFCISRLHIYSWSTQKCTDVVIGHLYQTYNPETKKQKKSHYGVSILIRKILLYMVTRWNYCTFWESSFLPYKLVWTKIIQFWLYSLTLTSRRMIKVMNSTTRRALNTINLTDSVMFWSIWNFDHFCREWTRVSNIFCGCARVGIDSLKLRRLS